MLTPSQRDAYLARIAWTGPLRPDAETLQKLHAAHLRSVPFENLDIHLGTPITLDVNRMVEKLVGGRGGFCYELNGAFAALLRTCGFSVDLLEARVPTAGKPEVPFDHLCLKVILADPWLADVGFGACFAEPLPLRSGEDLHDPNGVYRLETDAYGWWTLTEDGRVQYRFRLDARLLEEFEPGCRHHQFSAESHFTRNTVCSLPTERGRLTLRGDRLIETVDGTKTERVVSESERAAIYRERFGLVLARIPP
ncbi:MAG: arylamine N-acetyltransferase [Myxococcota bacterium]